MLVMSGSEWYPGMLSDQSFSLHGPGHSFITHSFLLKGEEPPMCIGYDELLTIQHILLSCSELTEIREGHCTAQSLHVFFRRFHLRRFLKEINMFGKM